MRGKVLLLLRRPSSLHQVAQLFPELEKLCMGAQEPPLGEGVSALPCEVSVLQLDATCNLKGLSDCILKVVLHAVANQVELPSVHWVQQLEQSVHQVASTSCNLVESAAAFVVETEHGSAGVVVVVCDVASQPEVVVALVAGSVVETQVLESAFVELLLWTASEFQALVGSAACLSDLMCSEWRLHFHFVRFDLCCYHIVRVALV